VNEQLIGDLFAEAMRQMTGSSSREFSQKFAELIVAECISIAVAGNAKAVVTVIKERFGVE